MSSGDSIDFKRLLSDLDILLNKGSLFGGWVSDVYDLTMIISNQNMTSDEFASNYYNSFSSSGCITNIDAFNIYKKLGNSLSETINQYYSTINNNERYSQFTANLGLSNISKDSIRTSVLANFKNCSEIINLLNIKGISLENNKNQVEGACYAFADFIYSKHPNKALINEINFNTEDLTLSIGEEKELNITTTPAIDYSLLNLSSSSPEIVSISNKKIKGNNEGSAVITCSYGGLSKTLNVKVVGKITSISFSEEIINIEAGSATKLEPIISPQNSTNYTFSSSNLEVADVDENGNIFSFKTGKTYIVCKSKDDDSIFAKCELNVTQNIQELKLNNTELTLAKGESCKLQLEVSPQKHSDKLIYSSSDESIVKINTQGNITAERVGEAIITCMSEANNEIKVECKITVTKAIQKIEFAKSFQTVDMSETPTLKLTVILTPSTANISNLVFEVSDKSIATLDTSTMTLTFLKKGAFAVTCKSKEDETVTARCNFYVLNSKGTEEEKEVKPNIKYDKEDEIEVDTIIDKNDTIVIEEEKEIFSMETIKKIVIALIVISIIIVLLFTYISETLKKNKDKILKGLGFENDFEEDLKKDKQLDEKTFHNVFKIRPQTEEEYLKLKEFLENKENNIDNKK